MPQKKIIIAVDGFSSCGKSTVAKSLAKELGYTYIDTGAMYRVVTLYAMRKNMINAGEPNIQNVIEALKNISISFKYNPDNQTNNTLLNGENVEDEIRRLDVSNNVSPISTIKEVRAEMVRFQREISEGKGVVMDGRDIGTVVFPNAELKIFMTASPKIRAQRRFDELTGKGQNVTFEEVSENIEKRDHIDQNRKESPLKKADDAVVLDNSHITISEQLDWAILKAKEIIKLQDGC